MKATLNLKPESKRGSVPDDESNLGFSKIFTDHMFTAEFKDEKWQNAQIKPFGMLSLHPAANVLHYSQEIFEGMKAFRQEKKDGVSFFRPEMNAKRMVASAKRMDMTPFPEEDFLSALQNLVSIDKQWTPKSQGTSLYIRPTLIGTEGMLGLKSSKEYLFYIILTPVGPYFSEGFNPIKIFVEEKHIRAVEGGVGEAKTGGNYSASLLAFRKAKELGYNQVLWLDAKEHKYVEEVGTMNQFFVIDDIIYTAPLDGTILKGVTRNSVITLAKDNGYKVKEEKLTIEKVTETIKNGSLTETFGAGTAASIAPVGELFYKNEKFIINDFKVGDISTKLYELLTGIQYGRIEDPYGWNISVQ